MIKRIVLGLLLASVSGALIYGGVYRTAARLNVEREGIEGQRQGFSQSQQSNRQNDRDDRDQKGGGYQGGGYQGGAERGLAQSGEFLPEQAEEINLRGIVLSVTSDLLQVRDSTGTEIVIENRAWWYAQEQGFFASVGDQLDLAGFYDENGVFEVSWIANLTLGSEVQIRDVSGRPNWAEGNGSQGRQGGRAG